MAESYEFKCPLCGVPRAKGQKRCICNYTFEYDRESRPFSRVSSSNLAVEGWTPARIALLVFTFVLLAAGAAALIAL